MEKKESIPEMMHAWAVVKPGPIDGEQSPLQFVLKPVPKPKRGEVLVKVLACGVCHTDLHFLHREPQKHGQAYRG